MRDDPSSSASKPCLIHSVHVGSVKPKPWHTFPLPQRNLDGLLVLIPRFYVDITLIDPLAAAALLSLLYQENQARCTINSFSQNILLFTRPGDDHGRQPSWYKNLILVCIISPFEEACSHFTWLLYQPLRNHTHQHLRSIPRSGLAQGVPRVNTGTQPQVN